MQDSNIEKVISEITDSWMAIEGVNGIAKGKAEDKDCILVFVSEKTQKLKDTIPLKLKHFTVKVMEIGDIDAQEPYE